MPSFDYYYSGPYAGATDLIRGGQDYSAGAFFVAGETDNGIGIQWTLGYLKETTSVTYSLDFLTTRCGNGDVEYPETCDDDNRTAGDGCDADCQKEEPVSGGGASGGGASGGGASSAAPRGSHDAEDDHYTLTDDGCSISHRVRLSPATGLPLLAWVVGLSLIVRRRRL